MTVDEAKALLDRAGLKVLKEMRLPNETGTQLRVSNGSIVNVFDKGTFNIQGKQTPQTQEILGSPSLSVQEGGSAVSGEKRRVFVVYGHD